MQRVKKLLCRLVGHAGPSGVPYKDSGPAPRESGNATLHRIEWECPRCGQVAWAVKIRPDCVSRAPGARRIEDNAD
jgi:hypothetical protein